MWWLIACKPLGLDATLVPTVVVYDPSAGTVPSPNDIARDAERRRLDLPVDEGTQSPAEVAFRNALNQMDGWSSVSAPSFTLSTPVDPASVDAQTVSVWEWGLSPAPVVDLERTVSEDGRTITVQPPLAGFVPGGSYVVVVQGLRAQDGTEVEADIAMTYLRAEVPLTEHDRAFPGATRAERLEAATALEGVRTSLVGTFAHFERLGVERNAIDALWAFTVTAHAELAMDAATERMPLPFDLLRDPATGMVDLPASIHDDELEADAKTVANTLDGFAVSADLTFEATADLDPLTVSDATVTLWRLGQTPTAVPAAVRAWREEGPCGPTDEGCRFVVVDPEPLPLDPGETYAIVVHRGVTDRLGQALVPMSIGHLLNVTVPLVDAEGKSVLLSVDDADASRIEGVRASVVDLLDRVGRAEVVTAWPFRTLDRVSALRETVALPERLGLDPNPVILDRGPPNRLFGADPLSDLFPGLFNPADLFYLPRIDGVAEVIEGTIRTPMHLDPVTRRWTEPSVPIDMHFLMTLPAGVPANEPVPVVIFGHAVVTDRRFALTVSGALAKRGFAVISVDFPYHGERIACVEASLVAVPNFFPPGLQPLIGATDPLLYFPPCVSGANASCSPTGQCLAPNGTVEPFASFPIVDVRPASGAAFLDVNDLPHIPDHFRQALVDLGSLRRSLQVGNWEAVLGRSIRTDSFLYAGQSLGAIIGAVYVAADQTIARAVLNVPGANMVELFEDSTFFGPQMDVYVDSLGVTKGTYEHERLLNVAHWLIDSVDPHTVGHVYRLEADRVEALIQIDRINADLGDIVIPNHTTDTLQAVSGLPMFEYASALHGDLVVPLVGDVMLEDLANFLAEGL